MGIRTVPWALALAMLALPRWVHAVDDVALPPLVAGVLAKHCTACHGRERHEADLRFDVLSGDFRDRAARAAWQLALRRIRAGEMPPDDRPRPTPEEVHALDRWQRERAQAADEARRREGRVVLRRLNRVEYENTVRDLLGIEIDLRDRLPVDTSAGGFDNIAEALHVSSFLMERYLDAAEAALEVAIARGPQPPLYHRRHDLRDERHVKTTTEKVFLRRDDALVCFCSSPWQAITLWSFYPSARGRYRIRITASAYQSAGRPVTFRLDAGNMLMAGRPHLVGYFDAPAEQPATFEFSERLEARETIRLLPYGLPNAQTVHKIGAEQYTGPGLALHAVEIEGPLHDCWPPESHRRIFGDLPRKEIGRGAVEVVSEQPSADAARILQGFVRRAYRRAVQESDWRPFAALFERKLAAGHSFEAALRVALQGVLVSPDFLFLREKPGRLHDYALASRLSYFLWSSMPDDELLAQAAAGQLARPEVLREQVERMLNSPRSRALVEHFTGQWLGLRDIDFTAPDHLLYPEFDDLLKDSMVREAHEFFREVLRADLSATNFVASDFTYLNARLARHYGIEGVEGNLLRKCPLPPGSHRGGVLTMAAVMKVTANGTNTSPVVRGAWVLDRLLGQSPRPPPAGVPAIEPDIRGATTIREQLARHRADQACAVCHQAIDPPGFALESFDVIGGWRTHYRSLGRGEPVHREGRRLPYSRGPAVDPSGVLPDGRPFADIDGLRKLLLANPDQLVRNLVQKLVAYGTGCVADDQDADEVDAIVARVREENYGLRALVHAVVASKLFREK